MKLRLLLTFDHELPLGGVRSSYEDALFSPTKSLFELASSLQVPVVLFTDVLSAIRFKDWDEKGFFIPYVQQLREAVNQGHDIQLHLHPHWLSSTFSKGSFIPSKDYRLADFVHHEEYPIERIVAIGRTFLDDTLKNHYPEYRCIAFRAGGYNLEGPRENILKSLISQGIKYESSITKGYYFRSSLSEIDYRKMPKEANWIIGENGNLGQNAIAGLQEIPIASIPKTPFEIPTRFKLKKLAHQAPPDRGYQIHEGNPADFFSRIRMMFSARMLSFDNYTLDADYLMKILHYNVRKYAGQEEVRLCVSGHPKSMGAYSFSLMKDFVTRVRKAYPEVEFTTFRDLFNHDYPQC